MVLHNCCSSRYMVFPVDQEVAEMIEKQNKMKVVRKSSDNTTDTVSLRLGQLAHVDFYRIGGHIYPEVVHGSCQQQQQPVI